MTSSQSLLRVKNGANRSPCSHEAYPVANDATKRQTALSVTQQSTDDCAEAVAAAATASPFGSGSPDVRRSRSPEMELRPPAQPKRAAFSSTMGAPPNRAEETTPQSDGGFWLGPRVETAIRQLVLLASGLNVLVFPVHLAFNGGVAVTSGWFPIYMLADAVLWLDVMARFATPVWSDDRAQQLSRRRVAVGYLRAELVPDLLIRFPWDAALTRPFGLSYGHLARALTLRRVVSIWHSRTGTQPRFVDSRSQLAALCAVSIVALHWYACATWLDCLFERKSVLID